MVITGQEYDVIRTVLGISTLVLSARLFAAVAYRLKIPGVIGEIFAGIVFGPYALGSFLQILGAPLIDLNPLFLSFSQIGSVIVLLSIGLSFMPADLLSSGIAGSAVALFGVLVPFTLGYLATNYLGFGTNANALIVGASLTATSIAITYEVLRELKKHKTKEAKIMVSAAIVDDILGIIILSIVLAIAENDTLAIGSIAAQFIFTFVVWISLAVLAMVFAPRVIKLISRSESDGAVEAGVTMLTFSFAIFAMFLGMSPIVGAFVVGMSLSKSEFYKKIRSFVSHLMMIFGPLFFAVIGTYLNPAVISLQNAYMIAIFLVIAVASKYVGCALPSMLFLRDWKKASTIGIGMATRGEIGFIILGVALAGGVISTTIYSVLLVVLIATGIVASILLHGAYGGE